MERCYYILCEYNGIWWIGLIWRLNMAFAKFFTFDEMALYFSKLQKRDGRKMIIYIVHACIAYTEFYVSTNVCLCVYCHVKSNSTVFSTPFFRTHSWTWKMENDGQDIILLHTLSLGVLSMVYIRINEAQALSKNV